MRLLSGSACDLNMAARYVRHLTEPVFGQCVAFCPTKSLLYAQAVDAVFPKTMPEAVSLRKSSSVLYAAVLCGCVGREREGGGAGNFPLVVAAAAAAGSFSTDRGIRFACLSSPSCPV